MSMRCRLTLVNAYSYDDILGVCLPKIPSHTLITLHCTESVHFILTYLISVLVAVTLLIIGFY